MCLGIPGKVTEIYQADGMRMGRVNFGGIVREACLEYLPDIEVGDYTIVHVGFGISRLKDSEALEFLQETETFADELRSEDTR